MEYKTIHSVGSVVILVQFVKLGGSCQSSKCPLVKKDFLVCSIPCPDSEVYGSDWLDGAVLFMFFFQYLVRLSVVAVKEIGGEICHAIHVLNFLFLFISITSLSKVDPQTKFNIISFLPPHSPPHLISLTNEFIPFYFAFLFLVWLPAAANTDV